MENKIKKRKLEDKPQFQFYISCPVCKKEGIKKEITGTSSKHVESNLDAHLKLKHTRDKK
ncbi:hypothetical protein LCGC14_1882000 [marine sediment metagenome]|uniref:Uncharacterized protein n=1 Tax=marine sediment metagenome TaxID=412755 RepID=A0A0F9GQ96_9ZZZZ